ncbi:MAG: hypothetical protein MK005_18430, partial [Alcanivorax sp.]|nr:hypothetical protein [Alcanivorax sp.]
MLPNAGPKSVIPWLLAVLLPALLAGCQTPAPRGLPDLRGGGTRTARGLREVLCQSAGQSLGVSREGTPGRPL